MSVMLLQAFGKVVVLVDYQANKEFIMEFLCINRDRPELKCEGKCQLTKKLKAQHESDKQANERGQKQEVQINLYCQNLFYLQPYKQASVVSHTTAYSCGYSSVAYQSIFHPPQFIV